MAWYSDWGFRKQIDVQDTNVDGALTDFPVLVQLTADADFHEALATGYDIRFTLSDGSTLLYYERESWSGGAGSAATADFWVKVPSIAASGGATIYIYYGKAGAADGQDAANVWNANYQLIWHLDDSGAGWPNDIYDSTSNANHGTKRAANEPNEVAGKVYKAQEFDGANDDLQTKDNIGVTGSTNRTMECWLKTSDNVNLQCPISWGVTSNYAKWWFYLDGSDAWELSIRNANREWSDVYADGSWHHMAVVLDGTKTSDLIGYFDGAVSTPDATNDETINTGAGDLFAGQDSGSGNGFTGTLDELRISDTARSAAWIKFEHANINEADNELTWGAEEAAAGGGFIPYDFSGDLRGGINALSGGLS